MLESIMKQLFGAAPPRSSQIAHDRLKLVLMHDRASISPEIMEKIKDDIMRVISRYVEIDRTGTEVSLESDEESVALVANIPVNGMRGRIQVRS